MVAIQWIVVVIFLLISWELAANIARFYFNKVYVQVLLRMKDYRWLDLLNIFLITTPAVVSGIFIVALMESLLYQLFPVLRTVFFQNVRFYANAILYAVIFFVQIQADTQHYHKKMHELVQSGEVEKLLQKAKEELDREEAQEMELEKQLQEAKEELNRADYERGRKRKGPLSSRR